MTGSAVKRKRFEGLIQFQEPLRQALVCIQASGGLRFQTAVQSEFLKTRNSEDLSYFLMTSDGSPLGETAKGLSPEEILMSVEQLDDENPEWKQKAPADDVKISAWVNTGDPWVCQQIYGLLAAATAECNESTFDLNKLTVSGALKTSLKDSFNTAWMKGERETLFKSFVRDAQKIFTADKSTVTTDGCSVNLMLEGATDLSAKDAFQKAITHLKHPSRHFVIFNYITAPLERPRIQCVYLTPMRLPLKELQTVGMKGFVLLRDIKTSAKLTKSVLAS